MKYLFYQLKCLYILLSPSIEHSRIYLQFYLLFYVTFKLHYIDSHHTESLL
jgi:hypothetical protein